MGRATYEVGDSQTAIVAAAQEVSALVMRRYGLQGIVVPEDASCAVRYVVNAGVHIDDLCRLFKSRTDLSVLAIEARYGVYISLVSPGDVVCGLIIRYREADGS